MNKTVFFILRLVVAIILIQTLRYKFTGHPDSIYIFRTIGLEPYGRIAIGVVELIAAILILIPRTIWLGALLTVGVLSGAIFFHLTVLGVEINEDGGTLFFMAVLTCLLGILALWRERKALPIVGKLL
jgi:uncharacterized membrane protein YphA (DoxX/SURF4 family)